MSRPDPVRPGTSRRPGRSWLFAGTALLLGGCDALKLGFLNAQGPIAAGESRLFVIVVIVMLFVIAPVVLLAPLFAWHYRLSNRRNHFRPQWTFSWIVEFFIWIPPTAIVVGLAFLLWHRTHRFDPYATIASSSPVVEVQAVALDWKWLFIYPANGIATVNELAIPAGRPVHLTLTSGTVMQSMLIPQLAGQIYAMAGMTTQLNLAADEPGTYVGENTQYNGNGFARQKFAVRSMDPAAYEQWLTTTRAEGVALDDGAYRRLFQPSTEPKAILYSAVPADLFQRILKRAETGAGTAVRRP